MRGRPPSPAAAGVVELLRPTALSPASIAGQTGMSVPSVTRYARQLAAEGFVRPGEASDQRVAETRATLLRLAGERTLDGPSWRQVVAGKLDISLSAVSKAYRKGVSLATRERWLRSPPMHPAPPASPATPDIVDAVMASPCSYPGCLHPAVCFLGPTMMPLCFKHLSKLVHEVEAEASVPSSGTDPEILGAMAYIGNLLIDSRTKPVRVATMCVATMCVACGRLPAMKVEGEHGFTLCNGCYFLREGVAFAP